jgi:Tfp pilus assembly protein PilF
LDYRSIVEHAMSTLRSGDLQGADELFSRVVAMNPGDAGSWNVLALIALQTARPELALERARRAHELDRDHPDYLNTMGLALGERGDLSTAEAVFRRALKSRPDSAELHYNHGRALYRQGRLPQALAAYRRAAAIDPRHPGALNNEAGALFELGKVAEARALLERAVAVDPADELALDNLAMVIFKTQGPHAVCTMFRGHLDRHPHLQHARLSYATALLAAGEFAEGWHQYRRSARMRDASDVDAIERLPDDLGGRRVLVRTEQGLGDVLFFLRFVGRLRERGARVTLESPAKLLAVLSGLEGFERVIPTIGPGRPRGYDLVLHLGDLPDLVGGDPAGAHIPIEPDGANIAEVRRVLTAAGPAPYVALTWRAGTVEREGFMRAAGLSLFKEVPLADITRALSGVNATVVVVQRGPAAHESELLRRALGRPVCDMSRLNDDLPRMVALLRLVDEYVGVSNTNMHIREAVGKTARVLLPYPAEWRWMFEGQSPWFPGFAVYRQSPGNDWSDALRRLRADLVGRAETA